MYLQYKVNILTLIGLEIVDKILDTEAVLIANPHSSHMSVVEMVKRRLLGTKSSSIHNDTCQKYFVPMSELLFYYYLPTLVEFSRTSCTFLFNKR